MFLHVKIVTESQILKKKEFETPLDSTNIDVSVVEKVLKELNAAKSMGSDELNPLMLKSMSKAYAVPLTLIFQVWQDP